MKHLSLITSTAMIAFGAPAFAGSLSEPAPQPTPAPVYTPAPVSGGQDWTGFYAGGSLGYADLSDNAAVLGPDTNGMTYGAHVGYDRDFGSFVLGGELEISGADITDSVSGVSIDSITRAKLRAGYDAGNFLPYFTAGAAQVTTSGAINDSDTGAFYGLGVDYRVRDNVRVGAELLDHQFNDYAGSGNDISATTLGARVSFEF